jgi:hypothetical protein
MYFTAPTIHCPTCGFEGKAIVKGATGGAWLIFLVCLIAGVIFWPLLLVAAILFFVLLFTSRLICRDCRAVNGQADSRSASEIMQGKPR